MRKNIQKGCSIIKITQPKILKANAESCSEALTELISSTLFASSFLTKLKITDISTVFKKDGKLKMKNHRPVSVLPVIFKRYLKESYRKK